MVTKGSAMDAVRDVQVLAPMQRGVLGASGLNLALQEALNGDASKPSIEKFGWTYRVGDKVMHTENDYEKEVYNGDIGTIAGLDAEEGELAIEFDGRLVPYPFGELDQVTLAYATTIHKAQGSKYPAVVIPVAMTHYMMPRRNLIYTGITRGKRLGILVGQKRALALAVRTADEGRQLVEAARLAGESLIQTRRFPLSEADFPVHTPAPYARALRKNAREFPPK